MQVNTSRLLPMLLGGVLLAPCPGCSTGSSRELNECERASEEQQHERAFEVCSNGYEVSAAPRAGLLAMRALYFLGRYEEALLWEERLRATPVATAALNLAGYAEIGLQRIEAGIARLQEAAPRFEREGDPDGATRAWYQACTSRWAQSRYSDAVRHCAEAFRTARQTKDPYLQGVVVDGMFALFLDVGDLSACRWLLSQIDSGAIEVDPSLNGSFLNDEGLLRQAEGRPEMARDAWERSIAALSPAAEPVLVRGIRLNLAEVHLSLGDLRQAEEQLSAAEALVDDSATSRLAFRYYRGRLRQEQGDFPAAVDEFRSAIEANREAGSLPDWEWRLQVQLGRAEQARGDVAAAAGAFGLAIAALEQMRRDSTLTDLKAWESAEKRQAYEALFLVHARGGEAARALDVVEQATARTFLDVLASAVQAEAPEQAADVAQRVETLGAVLPVVHESGSAAPRGVAELLDRLGQRTALIYFDAETEVWRLTVQGGRIDVRRLLGTKASIATLTRRFLARPADAALAAELARIILPAALPAAGSHLFIVTDGLFGDVPFSALRRNGRYLIQDYTWSVVPSLSVLASLEEQPLATSDAVAIFGDAEGDLPHAADEARRIGEQLGVGPLVGSSATSKALGQAGGGRLLHLALHSGLDDRGPWLQLHDQRVGPDELLRWRLGADVVVLASCASSARGRRGLWGSLVATFLANGSGAVIGSLWSVEDQAARRFVLDFYEAVEATDPPRALAEAQRRAIAREDAPEAWAAFVAYGSPRTVRHTAGTE